MNTSEQIRELAKIKGLSLTKFAEKLNMSKQALNNKLRNNRFTVQDLYFISKALDVEYKSYFVIGDKEI